MENQERLEEHKELVAKAIDLCGGQTAVSRVIGVTQPTVFGWIQNGLPTTEFRATSKRKKTYYAEALEELTKGQVTREQLLDFE